MNRLATHFLTVKPCDHTAPFCDGPDDCPGWGDECALECTSGPNGDCQWMCPTCSDIDGEWAYAGNGSCWQGHAMEPCDCLVVAWLDGQSTELVVADPRVGTHAVEYEWSDGYTVYYHDAEVNA